MQAYDFMILLLLLAATVWGARRGFAKQLATLASLVLGYVVAVNYRAPVGAMIEATHPWNLFAAMIGLFLATSLAIWLAFRFVNSSIEKSGLKSFDTQAGGLFGLAKGIIIAMAVTMFAVVMVGDAQRQAILGSFSGYHICRALNRAHSIVPEELQQAMQPYLETVAEHQPPIAQPPISLQQQLPEQTSVKPLLFDPPPAERYPDPFEVASPSDLPSPYEDVRFGDLQTPKSQRQAPASRDRRDDDRYANQPPSQATLQTPLFDKRR